MPSFLSRLLQVQPPRWRLRTGLLMPIALVVPLFLALTGVLWEGVARHEAETLVAQRQETALAGLSVQLNERRHANETIVYLLSNPSATGWAISSRQPTMKHAVNCRCGKSPATSIRR